MLSFLLDSFFACLQYLHHVFIETSRTAGSGKVAKSRAIKPSGAGARSGKAAESSASKSSGAEAGSSNVANSEAGKELHAVAVVVTGTEGGHAHLEAIVQVVEWCIASGFSYIFMYDPDGTFKTKHQQVQLQLQASSALGCRQVQTQLGWQRERVPGSGESQQCIVCKVAGRTYQESSSQLTKQMIAAASPDVAVDPNMILTRGCEIYHMGILELASHDGFQAMLRRYLNTEQRLGK
eukprot:gene30422-35427_t